MFFLVGLFNNNGYVLVQAGSNSLANEFHEGQFMAVFQFVMAVVIGFSRFVNANLIVNWPHLKRSHIVTVFQVLSFILIALATMHDDNRNFFWVAVGASVFTGVG